MLSNLFCGPGDRPKLGWIAWSGFGGFLGILAIEQIGRWIGLRHPDTLFLIGSFGATAVLVYGAPQAPFSQPRNVIVGHCLSALVGVSALMIVGDQSFIACPLAVSLAIAVMQLTGTVHPPGGATALIAVIGGDSVHQLGYTYALCPVGLGACIMVGVACAVNNLGKNPNRKYPASSC